MRSFKLLFVLFFIYGCFACKSNNKDGFDKEEALSDDVSDPHQLDNRLIFEKVLVSSSIKIRFLIENKMPEERYRVGNEELYSSVLIPRFYVNNHFLPAWVKAHDSLDKVFEMIDFIQQIEYQGLTPDHYHFKPLDSIRKIIQADAKLISDPNLLTTLDLLLTDAFFMVSSHLYNGKVNPENLTAEWGIQRGKPELVLDEKLSKMLKSNSVNKFMEIFYPYNHGYKLMLEKAKWIKQRINEDFHLDIPMQALVLDIFEDSTYHHSLNKKLYFLGFTEQEKLSYADSLTTLHRAITDFQKAHGLNFDGKIGKITLEALNTSLEERLKQLYVNMERLRWLPEKNGEKRILVNIADFTLDFMQNTDTLLHIKTVVGKNFRQTPVFNAKMTYLVFSPTWTVPPGILRNDILPEIAKNTNYLKEKNMLVLDRSGKSIPPETIDWKKAVKGSFPYMIRQQPGNHNALGRVKFMFPNKYSVYLHDTPSKSLFSRDERIFSSGCIRVEKPAELAKLILNDSVQWNEEKIRSAMNLSSEKTVILKQPIDVYIYYLTAWGSNNQVNFRKDIYQRDDEVYQSLLTKK